MATIRIEKKSGEDIFKADYKIPHIVAGTQVQQFIKEALICKSVHGVKKCVFIKDKDIFTDLTQLYQEMETNQFLFTLYKYMHKSYKEIDGTVREDNILILFNLAFRIACATLNTQNPATRFSYWDKRIEDYFFRIHEFSVTWVMVYCILNEEKEKTQFMELFLDDLKTDFWFESGFELFDSITHTTPDKVEHMQESVPTPSARDENEEEKTKKIQTKKEDTHPDKKLFIDPDVAEREAERFKTFVEKNIKEKILDARKNNELTEAFFCFLKHWKENGLIEREVKADYLRFLRNRCGYQKKETVSYSSIDSFLGKMVRKPRLSNIEKKVDEFFKTHTS